MKSIRPFLAFLALAASIVTIYGFSQDEGKVDRKQLRDMLVQLGYEVKDIVTTPGKEKYSANFNRDGLDIPIGYEISPSGSYIWLTVNLGDAPDDASPKNAALLRQNGKIQPSQFYVTEATKRLMAATPVENKGITNALLRQRSESLAGTVGSTKEIWQK